MFVYLLWCYYVVKSMIMKQNKAKATFRVIFKKPLKVKTLKEYEQSKEEVVHKRKIILKDTDEEVLFLHEDNRKK